MTHQLRTDNQLIVYTDSGAEKISRHLYGHFAEHVGHCIYGGFYTGAGNTAVPNMNGIRHDVVHALKDLHIPNLRWPGGCFADTYHWKDGIGPKHARPAIVNRWWGNVTEDNSFGTHDFLDLCEMLAAEPYLAANVGSGTVQELADWVQYVNFEGVSPMSDLRKRHGRDRPWQVKFWGLGNEAWGCGGNMTASYYANVYRQFATFMTGWSNTEKLFRIASGANSADYLWTETLMRDIPHTLLEGIALHHYAVTDWNNKGPATGFSEAQYFSTMKAALRMDEVIAGHSAIMDVYDPQRRIALVVDEWGAWYDTEPGTNPGFLFQQNTLRDALVAGVTLHTFHRHCARVRMANLAQTVNVLQAVIFTDGEAMLLTPTYHVMKMFRVHHDAALLPMDAVVCGYASGDESLPAISASASADPQGIVHLSLVNIDMAKSQEISVILKGGEFNQVHGSMLCSTHPDDHNSFVDPVRVSTKPFEDMHLADNRLELVMPPCSVAVLELEGPQSTVYSPRSTVHGLQSTDE
jgi:alpha-L-arabinofuranosidase